MLHPRDVFTISRRSAVMPPLAEFRCDVELQRPKTPADQQAIAETFRPYLVARDWVSINRGEVVTFDPQR
ncbi:hypothetical protein A5698_08450 [Mycobacterium sp. E136]|nr:hypothetical protein A5698_08450 [Mycobacterium sp. E136]